MSDYNGWKNWETWNVALWIQNDEGLYNHARSYKRMKYPYHTLAENLRECGVIATPDGASYKNANLDRLALDEMIREL